MAGSQYSKSGCLLSRKHVCHFPKFEPIITIIFDTWVFFYSSPARLMSNGGRDGRQQADRQASKQGHTLFSDKRQFIRPFVHQSCHSDTCDTIASFGFHAGDRCLPSATETRNPPFLRLSDFENDRNHLQKHRFFMV